MTDRPSTPASDASQHDPQMDTSAAPLPGADGDQTGDNTCPDCAGEGTAHGEQCSTCAGSGLVVEPLGDA